MVDFKRTEIINLVNGNDGENEFWFPNGRPVDRARTRISKLITEMPAELCTHTRARLTESDWIRVFLSHLGQNVANRTGSTPDVRITPTRPRQGTAKR